MSGARAALSRELEGEIEGLFQAQLSYYRGEQAAAQELAVKVFKLSSDGGQNMLGASAAFYLCNIARDKGDVPLWNTYIDALQGIEHRKDTAGSLAWVLRHRLLLSLTPSVYVPQSLKEGVFGNIPMGKGWRFLKNGLHPELMMEAKAVHIQYLARSGQYEAAPYNRVREGIVWVGSRTFEKAGKMRTAVMGEKIW